MPLDTPARITRTDGGAGPGGLDPRRWLILSICCLSLLIVGLDVTIVNVALPSIHRELHAPLDGLQWIIDAYTLVIASLLILGGSTGDRIGRKRVFSIGLIVFTAGSALCAVAPSLDFLIAARALQAVGGSMLNPVAMSIVRNTFTDSRERAQAIGMWGAVVGIATAAGPVVGGVLVDTAGWRYVFLVNVPVGLVALALTTRYVPESKAPRPRRIDPIGQLLVIAGLGALVFAIIEGPRAGWLSAEILGLFGAATVILVALVRVELRVPEPLIEFRCFRSAPLAGASLAAIATFAANGGLLFLGTLYLQDVRGLSALDAGLYLLPMAAMIILLAPISGRIVGTRGPRWPMIASGLLMGISPLLLIGLSPTTHPWLILASFTLFGVGMGLVNPPITNTAVTGMPPAQAGVAGAIASTSRQTGAALGVALAGAIAGAGAGTAFRGGAFATATHPAWWLLAALGLTVLGCGVVTTGSWAQSTAERAAEMFETDPVPAPVPV